MRGRGLPVVEGEDSGQLLHAELLCKLRQRVDVDLGKPYRAFQSSNVLLKQLRRAGRVLHFFTRGGEEGGGTGVSVLHGSHHDA
jgi:hypothetical protein